MAGPNLTVLTTMCCPHGGQVHVTGYSRDQVRVQEGATGSTRRVDMKDRNPLLGMQDSYVITGCANVRNVGGAAHPDPCVRLVWTTGDERVTINGVPALNVDSVGLCCTASNAVAGRVIVMSTGAVNVS